MIAPPPLFVTSTDTAAVVEICLYNTSTKRSSNRAPFDKISKSGDGVGSGDIFCNPLEM
jgi:hypothetical protein